MDAERVETRDDAVLLVRPIEPDDRDALVRGFEHLSDASRYKRFLAPIRRLTGGELAYLTEVDHHDHEALVALTEEGEMVGIARAVREAEDPSRAEVAVTVADEWQGRGVGTLLLRRVAGWAREEGVERLFGLCLADNTEMQQLLTELGPDTRTVAREGGVVEIEAPLPAEDRAQESAQLALRMAARGAQRAGR